MAAPHNSIYIQTKDFRLIRITFSGFENNRNRAETNFNLMYSVAFYNSGIYNVGGPVKDPAFVADNARSTLFAFQYQPVFSLTDNAWNMSDIIKEYVRMGIYDAKSEWKVSIRCCCSVHQITIFN
jgi:hypothetical protein